MEKFIKQACLIAPFIFIILLSPSRGDLAGLVLIFIPYVIVFLLVHFVKNKSRTFLIANTGLVLVLMLSSMVMFFGVGSDPQAAIGVFIVFVAQVLLSALFVSVYFVIRAFKN